jgi:tetratricopeptide (TPR) repeat protein
MSSPFERKPFYFASVAAVVFLILPSVSRAQGGNTSPNLFVAGNEMEERMELSNMDALGDKDQVAAYKAFVKQQDPAKKIQLGDTFLQKYPKTPLRERVDAGMMDAYRSQQDWKDAYQSADNALALQPNDIDVLTTISWTIPHVYNPNDPDADQQLAKAETYAKHALDLLAKVSKPAGMNDVQFAAAKAKRTFQAHSALGLVDFRREDYDNSAKELALATKGNPLQDQTDLFVLGADLQNLNRFSEAADAFGTCSQIAGPLQDQCKQQAAASTARANLAKIK